MEFQDRYINHIINLNCMVIETYVPQTPIYNIDINNMFFESILFNVFIIR